MLLVATLLWGSPAEASVPGAAFTETGCEGSSDSVARLYTAGLGREGEHFGVAYWAGEVDKSGERMTTLMRFAESPENIAKSGTVPPTLGEYNNGRSRRWTCAGWEPAGGFDDTSSDSCEMVGRDFEGSPSIRIRITNPTAHTATADVQIGVFVDGVRRNQQYSDVWIVEPGETVEHDDWIQDSIFKSRNLDSVTCEMLEINWYAVLNIDEIVDGCRLIEMDELGRWEVEVGTRNPFPLAVDAVVGLLVYVDGRRVNFAFDIIENIPADSQTFPGAGLNTESVRYVERSRIRCELVLLDWQES